MSDIETLERLLADRRSCRGFTDEQVPRKVIERLLAAAQRTASWCNTQPWHVVITSGEATRELAAAMLAVPAPGRSAAEGLLHGETPPP